VTALTFACLVAIPSFTQNAEAQSDDCEYNGGCVTGYGSYTPVIIDWSWVSQPYYFNPEDSYGSGGGGGGGSSTTSVDNTYEPNSNINCSSSSGPTNLEVIRIYRLYRQSIFDTYALDSLRIIALGGILNNGLTINWSNGDTGTYLIEDGWIDNGGLNAISADEVTCS